MQYVVCRAAVATDCTSAQYEDGRIPMIENEGQEHEIDHSEDGFFKVTDGIPSIVCMACYAVLMPFSESGKLLHGEEEGALKRYREMKGPLVTTDSEPVAKLGITRELKRLSGDLD